MAQGKAGMAGGVVLAAGIGLARFGDDCASAGVRTARLSDDIAGGAAGVGRTVNWGADDAVRMGRGGRGIGSPRVRGIAVDDGALAIRSAEGSWPEALLESGVDLGLEVVQMDLDDVSPTVANADELRCPRVLDVVEDSAAWDGLLGGLGVACAPVVVVGVADDAGSLRMGDEVSPLSELARACLDVEAQCVFVGCPADVAEACVESVRTRMLRTKLQRTLGGFVRVLAREVLEGSPSPVFFGRVSSAMGGLVVARPTRGR